MIALVTYFISKPFLALAATTAAPQSSSSKTAQQAFEQLHQQFKARATHQDQRPKQGFQGGEYIDFEEL